MTVCRLLFLFVTSVSLFQAVSPFLWYRTQYDSPEDEDTFPIIEAVGGHVDYIISETLEALDLDPWQQDQIIEELLIPTTLTNDTSGSCTQCIDTTSFLMSLVHRGLTYDDLRNVSIRVCKVLVSDPDVNWDGDLLCEGILDNYGPHVVYILNATEHSPEEACIILNSCKPYVTEISESPESNQEYVVPQNPWRDEDSGRRNVTLEDAIKVIHITDIHAEPEYDEGAASVCQMPFCCRDEWEGTGYAGPWGTYGCNIPVRTADLYMEFLAGLDAHYLMFTGDSPPSTPWLETQEHQINMSRMISDMIGTYFPNVPSFSTIGNHESYPTNLYYTGRADILELNAAWGEMWQALGGFDDQQLDNIKLGGFYTKVVQPGLRILSYNSNFQATSNWYVLLDQESHGYAAMRQFMEETFNTARANGEKVILLSHHCTGAGGSVIEYSEFITDICRRNADLIVLHLLGHSHRDKFHMNTDPVTGDVYDVQISSGAMSSAPEMNPNARLFYLHPDTFQVMDADTFFLDLQNPRNNGSFPVIKLAYRATEEYGLDDFSPQSMKEMVDRMETDDELVSKYLYNFDTRTGFNDVTCDESCKADLLCELRTTSYHQRRACK